MYTLLSFQQHPSFTNQTTFNNNNKHQQPTTSLIQNQQQQQQHRNFTQSNVATSFPHNTNNLPVATSATTTSLGQNFINCKSIATALQQQQQHQSQHINMGPTNINGTQQQQPAQLQQLQQMQQHQPQQHLQQQQLTTDNQHHHIQQQQQLQQQQQQQAGSDQLSKTNVYIRGLPEGTTDKDLVILCSE